MHPLRRSILAALAIGLVAAVPTAQAVVGGAKIDAEDVPWFTYVSGCGGTLVQPDRLLTAAHCAANHTPSDMGQVAVGGELRTVTHVALHPGWRHRNGENYMDDVAIVQLDAPVTSVTPVTLADKPTTGLARIIGSGRPFAPGTHHSEAEMLGGGLRQADLRQVGDSDCAKVYARNHPGTGERFNAARMLCAVDPDGKQPLSSGCFGDSGGPLIAGTTQLGVVSWGGDKCGADHSPSVFAEVARYRDFILDPTPAWGPSHRTTVRLAGKRCHAATREPGTKLRYEITRRGHRVTCNAYASNDGGELLVGTDTQRG
ncbi:MAG TPA: serine protease [Solirubrobacter sp.]